MTAGKTLRLERVAADLLVKDLAHAMGVSRQAIYGIERRPIVKPARAAEYRAAIARLSAARRN